VEISNDHAAESSVASFCERDHYSSFQTCFEDVPARHASLNGIQKRFKIEASKEILVFLLMPYPTIQSGMLGE
jgi:hypothetical protein